MPAVRGPGIEGERKVLQELPSIIQGLFGNHQYCGISHRAYVSEVLALDEVSNIGAAQNAVDQSNVLGAECSYQGKVVGCILRRRPGRRRTR